GSTRRAGWHGGARRSSPQLLRLVQQRDPRYPQRMTELVNLVKVGTGERLRDHDRVVVLVDEVADRNAVAEADLQVADADPGAVTGRVRVDPFDFHTRMTGHLLSSLLRSSHQAQRASVANNKAQTTMFAAWGINDTLKPGPCGPG